ncbi:MAG: ABC transporter ATP-binding protein [Alphaproteobacteria bacterium]|nr:ABC transporter ATP-binding protein [Alphaproteobacteria bacterium]
MSNPIETAVEVVNLGKKYGTVNALNSVSFSIQSGQYYALLGPSGGGKTTLLRLIGGFIRPTAGQIFLHGQDVSHLPPNKRPTSMVFQSYALFPHMNVEKNVAYGLKLRKMPRAEIYEKVNWILSLVGLEGYNERKPHELSGGQQQRVQLARSLVLDVDILLLDEPLAALDAKLRKDMCIELKRIQEKVGITFIHVTHNQEEALTVADRIAIIADGDLVEQGTARDIYETPQTRFTAGFIGDNNLLDGKVSDTNEKYLTVDLGYTKVNVPALSSRSNLGQEVSFSIRSELLSLIESDDFNGDGWQVIPATLLETIYLGLTTSYLVRLADNSEVVVRKISSGENHSKIESGQNIKVGWQTDHARLHIN